MDIHPTEVIDSSPPPAEPPPPAAPPIRRSTTDRMVAGVCGGVGRRYGIDPVVLRVAFVIAGLMAGLGVLLYIAAWLLLPLDTDRTAGLLTPNPLRLVIGVLFAVATFFTAVGWVQSLGGLAGLLVGGFAVGVGVWLYSRRGYVPPAVPEPPQGYAYGGTGGQYGQAVPPPPAQAWTPPAPPVVPRERSYLGGYVLLAAVAVIGLLGVMQALGVMNIGFTGFLAAAVGVLAVGLLVSAFAGRARWLVIPAVLLTLLMAGVAQVGQFLTVPLSAGVGERTWAPTSAGGDYRLSLGQGTVNLVPWGGDPAAEAPGGSDAISASMSVGQLRVVVPSNWTVVVDAATEAGTVQINGRELEQAGPSSRFVGTLPATGEAQGTLRLNLAVQIGQIDIVRRAPLSEVPLQGSLPGTLSPGPGQDADRPAPPESKQDNSQNNSGRNDR